MDLHDIIPIIYSAGYNITAGGLEKMHPFDSTKYKRIWAFLHGKNKALDINTHKFYLPSGLPNRKWLSEVMTKTYLLKLNYAIPVSSYVEVPVFFLPGWLLRS